MNIDKIPVPTEYEYMEKEEYLAGVRQMVDDLKQLASKGCIAAAWSLSVFQKLANDEQML